MRLLKVTSNLVMVVTFFALIYAPLADIQWSFDPTEELCEYRPLARLPPLPEKRSEIGAFISNFEEYYDDNFGFRRMLIKIQSLVRVDLLKTSTSDVIMLGQDDWLFFIPEGYIQERIGAAPLRSEELEAWMTVLTRRQAWLDRHQIGHLFVIAPDSATVNREHLPSWLQRRIGKTRRDQLLELLKQSPVNYEDLAQILIETKETHTYESLYLRTDTHWNDYGAYVGYCQLIDRIAENSRFAGLKPLPLDAFQPKTESPKDRDLARMLGGAELFPETLVNLKHKRDFGVVQQRMVLSHILSPCEFEDYRTYVTECPGGKGRLLMFADSFSHRLLPMLAPHFEQIVVVHRDNPTEAMLRALIERIQPDMVIEERVERSLKGTPGVEAYEMLADRGPRPRFALSRDFNPK